MTSMTEKVGATQLPRAFCFFDDRGQHIVMGANIQEAASALYEDAPPAPPEMIELDPALFPVTIRVEGVGPITLLLSQWMSGLDSPTVICSTAA